MHHSVINVSCTVRLVRNPGRKDDGAGGPLWQWKDFLHQPPKEAVRTSRGADPAGRQTAAPLQPQILTSKGTTLLFWKVYLYGPFLYQTLHKRQAGAHSRADVALVQILTKTGHVWKKVFPNIAAPPLSVISSKTKVTCFYIQNIH